MGVAVLVGQSQFLVHDIPLPDGFSCSIVQLHRDTTRRNRKDLVCLDVRLHGVGLLLPDDDSDAREAEPHSSSGGLASLHVQSIRVGQSCAWADWDTDVLGYRPFEPWFVLERAGKQGLER